jgi:hypothetical protein
MKHAPSCSMVGRSESEPVANTKYGLPGVDHHAIDHALPRCDEHERHDARLPHAEMGRLVREQVGIDGGIFGQRALVAAYATGHAKHLVAALEARNVGSERLHRSRHVDAEDGWQGMPGVFGSAGVDLGI